MSKIQIMKVADATRCYAWPMPLHGVRLSLCLSVCSSVMFVYSCFFAIGYPHHSSFFLAKHQNNRQLLTRSSNAGGVGKNRNSRQISGFILFCQRSDRQVLYTQLPDRGKLATLVSGVVCCPRRRTTKCLWREALTLRRRQPRDARV